MARWCARHGRACDGGRHARGAAQLLATLREELPAVAFVGGAFTPDLVQGTAVRAVYRSPGLTPETIAPVANAARAMGLPVGGELELFSQAGGPGEPGLRRLVLSSLARPDARAGGRDALWSAGNA
jgi:UDP-N-acetylmuramoylalanine--D-glutamate ligase